MFIEYKLNICLLKPYKHLIWLILSDLAPAFYFSTERIQENMLTRTLVRLICSIIRYLIVVTLSLKDYQPVEINLQKFCN